VALAPRRDPLAPRAVVGVGEVAARLARRAMALPAAALARLSGVGSPGICVLLGDADALPWVDGVTYLGRDPEAPSLLLPTTLAPTVPAHLVERALLAKAGAIATPLAVVPRAEGFALVAVGDARPVEAARLQAIAAGEAP
jgi:hypothetical protein